MLLFLGAISGLPGLAKGEENQITVREPAARGVIADRNGIVLAGNKPERLLTIDLRAILQAYQDEYGEIPTTTHFVQENGLKRERRVPDIVKALEANALPELHRLGLAVDFSARQMQNHFLDTSGLVPWIYRRGLSDEEATKLGDAGNSIVGVKVVESQQRDYPEGDLGSHVLGYVKLPDISQATKEERAAFDVYVAESRGGAGLEQSLDVQLRGEPGERVYTKTEAGNYGGGVLRKDPKPGAEVRLTIDSRIQSFARASNAKCRARRRSRDGPSQWRDSSRWSRFPPTTQITSSQRSQPHSGRLTPRTRPRRCSTRAIAEFLPGWTLTPAVALAGLGSKSRQETFTCEGGVAYGRKFMKCWIHARGGKHGEISLSDAMHRSCGSYFYQYGNNAGIDRIVEMSDKLGLGKKTGIPLANEAPGRVPSPRWLKTQGLLWSDGFTAMTSIGQGILRSDAPQMASMVSTVANGGKVYEPHLVKKQAVMLHDIADEGVTAEDMEMIRHSMWRVVNENTARGSRAKVQDWVAGETGTAQTGHPSEPTNAWFVGFAPYQEPEYAICVFVENGESGGRTAAPIAGSIFEQLLTGKVKTID